VITLIKAAWVIGYADGDHVIIADGQVVYEDSRISFVGRDYDGPADRILDAGNAIVGPGFIDLDALADIDHALIDCWQTPANILRLQWSEDYFHHRRRDVLPPAERDVKREFAFCQLLRNGITTAMSIAAETHSAWAETYDEMAAAAAIARRLGLRTYLGPSYRCGVNVARADGGRDVLWDEAEGQRGFTEAVRFARDFSQSDDDLVRACLLPCRLETLSLDIMRATAAAARQLGCPVRVHCLQGTLELQLLQEQHGRTPVELLADTGLLDTHLLIAHGIYIGGHSRNPRPYAGELETLAGAGVSVVHCPMTSLRFGSVLESFDRYRRAGVTLALGTDSYPPDMIRNMEYGSTLARWIDGRLDAGAAADFYRAATLGGAAALRRDDLGRLAPGCLADLIVVDLDAPRVGPVDDPIRTMLMNCTGENVRTVVVNGRTVVEDGDLPGVDAADLRRRAQAHFDAMKAAYAERDYRPTEPEPLFPPSFRHL